jgi:thiamine-phosphate pyrophosphorylase
MKNRLSLPFNLYLITDRRGCEGRDLLAVVEESLKGGVKAVQLREKELSSRELYELSSKMRKLTVRYGAGLFINDRIDVALAVKADGVHLGDNSIPIKIARMLAGENIRIGVSCHNRESAIAAQDMGADFITYGPVFFTPSKAAYGPPVGIDSLSEVTPLLWIPVFAIGGITSRNTRQVLDAGAHGIALISALISAENPSEEARTLLALLPPGVQDEE